MASTSTTAPASTAGATTTAVGKGAPPPSPLDVQRKLSVHTRPTQQQQPRTVPPPALSGTESDSDSGVPMTTTTSRSGGAGPMATALSAIAERRGDVGEESEDDEEDEGGGGWRVARRMPDAPENLVVKAGYLAKKGVRRKTWKKRWFVLRPPHLAYYKTEAEYKLLRLLDLQDIHTVTPVALKRHANTFGIVTQQRTFYLQADTREQQESWVQALVEARERLLATSSAASASQAGTPQPGNATPALPAATAAATAGAAGPADAGPSTLRSVSPSRARQAAPPPITPPGRHMQSSDDSDDEPSPVAASPPQPQPPMDPSKTVLAGYLMKCGSKRKHWRKRWFVLSAEKLVYAGSHMDSKPHRQIPLADILDALEFKPTTSHHKLPSPLGSPPVPPAGSPLVTSSGGDDEGPSGGGSGGGPGPYTFKIITPKRTLLLCAPSEEEEIQWLSAVRALIARRGKEASGGSSGVVGSATVGGSVGSGSGMIGVGHKKSGSVDRRARAGSHSGMLAVAGKSP